MDEKLLSALLERKHLMDVATGRERADLVIRNAKYVNVFTGEIGEGDIAICGNTIAGIGLYNGKTELDAAGFLVTPGLIDAHIHLESSLLNPAEFARAVLPHGTTTVITDPHEIANVMGTKGISYMLEATENLPVEVRFMLPSCVPATPMDESGAELDDKALDGFYTHPRVLGLAEMMNYVGVVNGTEDTLSKIVAAQHHGRMTDGHAPGLSGKELNAYVASGVYSDHECDNLKNALEKLRLGQYIMIREGTAAKNLKALVPLLQKQYAGRVLFATDDKHPSDLLDLGHIDYTIRSAIALGADPFVAIRAASLDAAAYFQLGKVGAVAPGYRADLILVNDLTRFEVQKVIKSGKTVYEAGKEICIKTAVSAELEALARDTFHLNPTRKEDFFAKSLPLLGIIPGEIITENLGMAIETDPEKDILKLAVVERHHHTGHIGMGYIKGYGLKKGAVATSIAHDSHNIIAVGAGDEDISFAVNRIRDNKGGIAVVENGRVLAELPLPIAGLMSDAPIEEVNEGLNAAKAAARKLGAGENIDPFMTLSFMSLPVIPKLKVTTQGVFDVDNWKYL